MVEGGAAGKEGESFFFFYLTQTCSTYKIRLATK